MCIIESVKLKIINDNIKYIIWTKPKNYLNIVKCNDMNDNKIDFVEQKDSIKIFNNNIKMFVIYYEVSNNFIYEYLKEICK